MFRKITRTGPATLTVAIPAKWAKAHKIKQGQYVEITESESDLIISPSLEKNPEKITIQYNEMLIENMLEKLFLESESTITIHSEEKIPENIQRLVERFPGLQITELEPNKVIINRTLKPLINNTEALLRRSYLVIKEALAQNPPYFSADLSEIFFLLQLYQKNTREVFILNEIYSTLLTLKEPSYDDAYALLKQVFNSVYEQRYRFSNSNAKDILSIFNRADELFQKFFQKSRSGLQISKIHYCIQSLSQLNKECVYKQSIEALSKTSRPSSKRYTVGVCLKNQSNPFWAVDVKESMMQAGQEYKDIEFVFSSPLTDFDIDEQEKILQKFISEQVDGIIFAPVQPKKLSNTINRVNKLKIPLLVIDTDIEFEDYKYTFIGFDNYKGGYLTGNYLKKHLRKGSTILIIKGHLEGNFTKRVYGFIDALGKDYKTKMIIGDFQESAAYEQTLEFMKKNKVDAIFATSDNMALGAVKATKTLGKKIPICGFDMTKEGLAALEKGELFSTVNSKPRELGVLAIQAMNNLITKRTVAERTEYSVEFVTRKHLAK